MSNTCVVVTERLPNQERSGSDQITPTRKKVKHGKNTVGKQIINFLARGQVHGYQLRSRRNELGWMRREI